MSTNTDLPRTITPKDLYNTYSASEYVLVDVRTPEEIENKKIEHPNRRNINVYDRNFEDKIRDLNLEKKYIIICRSGIRSSAAQRMFEQNELETANVEDGINGWTAQNLAT